ncbi:hypothetical protein [Haloglomus litoreum]|uniref:hypothetical protein n=1 Tax=Haloglomus litoreum TaxID=3034026 RepID=UPI0023E8FA4E|nr:hypothetical protein [Haloglomus sp. DT116]
MTTTAATTPTERSIRLPALRMPFGLWGVMAGLAVANGIFRELVLIPRIGEYPGHLLSTGLLVGAILAVSALYFTRSRTDYTPAELAVVGVGWTLMTVGFEFLVGYAEGTPVSVTLDQYDLLAGQVWIAVPLTLLVAPYLFGRLLRD